MKPTTAIAAFNIDRCTGIEAFLEEYRVVGLTTIELNGRVEQHVIDALLPYLERGEFRVSRLHNYCPVPGTGDVDFAFFKPCLRPDVLRVLEYGKRVHPIVRIKGASIT